MSLEDELKDCTKIQAWNKGYSEASRTLYRNDAVIRKCNVHGGQLLTDVCSCGHLVGVHRKDVSGAIICDPCQMTEEPIDRELARRLDGMVDGILRMEQRLIELIKSDAYQHGVSVLESVSGPSAYEVWADAFNLAVTERAHIDDDGVDSGGLLARTRWFWDQLHNVPIQKDGAL